MNNIKIQLPDGFLDEEVRCGYLVSHEMKKAWAVMLDLLVEFDRVCKKHNIRYFASGGTMLGAVRHKGFIPWDDDIDVMMERKDYIKLSEIASDEFKYPYFFQTKYTDPCCADSIAKLRNSNTTALFQAEKSTKIEYNKGIFIDVFVLDNIPDRSEELENFYKQVNDQKHRVYKIGRKLGIFSASNNLFVQYLKNCLYKLKTPYRKEHLNLYIQAYEKFESICQKYNSTDTKKYSLIQFGTAPINVRCKDDFKELILLDFEFLKIPVGAGYTHALSYHYGDNYMQYVIGASMHSEIVFDAERTYKKM